MKFSALLFASFLLLAGCSSSSSDGEPSADDLKEVKATIKSFLDYYNDKDIKTIKNIFTDEPQAIIFGIGNDVWKGKATIQKKIEKAAEDVEDSNIDVRDQVIKVSGNTAWFSERGDWGYDFKGQRVNLEGVRLTGVLLKQDGKWKLVQLHTSYPVRAQ